MITASAKPTSTKVFLLYFQHCYLSELKIHCLLLMNFETHFYRVQTRSIFFMTLLLMVVMAAAGGCNFQYWRYI
jgi:hypothetical protein